MAKKIARIIVWISGYAKTQRRGSLQSGIAKSKARWPKVLKRKVSLDTLVWSYFKTRWCAAKLTRRGRWWIQHRNVDMRDAHRPLSGGGLTLSLTFIGGGLTFTWAPSVLRAAAANATAAERLTGNHVGRFTIRFLYRQSADNRQQLRPTPACGLYSPKSGIEVRRNSPQFWAQFPPPQKNFWLKVFRSILGFLLLWRESFLRVYIEK